MNESDNSLATETPKVNCALQRFKTPLQRLFENIHETPSTLDCWIWSGPIQRFGYGCLTFMGRVLPAHRVSWMLLVGEIPTGLFVLHDCPTGDNPACINPRHLWLGTQTDNMADCRAKGRNNKGERNGGCKLNESDIIEIRKRRLTGETLTSIAKDYNVGFKHISQICTRRNWRYI